MFYIAFIAIVSGVLSFLSPCVLPLAPLYIAYFSGAGDLTRTESKVNLYTNLLSFFIGFTFVYLVLGLSVSFSFAFLQKHYLFRGLLGIILILFAFHYWKIINLPFLYMDTRKMKVKEFNLFSSLLFGILFAFGWSPCMGPLLGNVIVLASNSAGLWGKVFVLLMFCLGIIIPFILVAVMSVGLRKKVQGLVKYSRYIEVVSGGLLFGLGVWLLVS
ncbi:MAG: cytochrome c biogenesis CcdA family protein [Candidatus Margulisbacteria bacterium]|nr:cytochrome c biogenesis CcdA family protein [Candidatus Margulisiibacteriota bacterium]